MSQLGFTDTAQTTNPTDGSSRSTRSRLTKCGYKLGALLLTAHEVVDWGTKLRTVWRQRRLDNLLSDDITVDSPTRDESTLPLVDVPFGVVAASSVDGPLIPHHLVGGDLIATN